MLSAKRKLTGELITAYLARAAHAPFVCPDCNEEVILKAGKRFVNHFAHVNPIACKFAKGESDAHRQCKMEIYEALSREPNVSNVALERPLGIVRPDVSARINGIPVAIEVQISSLSIETIQRRTIEYARKGIYVLWLLQWTRELDAKSYSPQLWEKWIHATYFGRVYYWVHGLSVISYHFDAHFIAVPKHTWYSKDGEKMSAGGYVQKSKRHRKSIRGRTLNLVRDFAPRERYWWSGGRITVPDAKLFMNN